ncbi:heterokaryon incompatibility protein-domain-containing protein [Aspergillus welwitschiae]|uniref:Heterokaryon incompatibility protein-domain-containing protein n=1 Tax=Aspergillus welwitschiae TaxID=1341132 RepID=A0A3F3PJP4_9EURO|nr:heterokaryon incompatibility protein-domain-containing protein [Aspergillus welwitschiae]RDH27108.1 heterokaryon incompatibility protein-domain-containing protein [Aspergillus welwitschiae]
MHFQKCADIAHSFQYENLNRSCSLMPIRSFRRGLNAPIKCELFNYTFSDTGDGRHLYEALSYVWRSDGESSDIKSQSIILNDCTFPVTKNLYAALFHLRDYQLGRTLWVDAICINQHDGEEKNQQIPLMRTIYAQANCVIVWLGEAIEDGNKALESIRCLAEDKAMKDRPSSPQEWNINYDACLKLLQRNWFRRIWVLQEVGVARCISIMCGSVQINGHVFCEGLSRLDLTSPLLRLVHPVIHLIRGAIFRPKYELDSRGTFSIGELIDMYHSHQATNQHDKIYALLGLSVDDPSTGALKPNYDLPWNEVFKQTITYILSRKCSVDTWSGRETAVIKGEGWILGQIESIQGGIADYGQQRINILFTNTAQSLSFKKIWGTEWILQASATAIQEGDIVCLLQGASKPSIIRLCRDCFIIVKAIVIPQQSCEKGSWDKKFHHETHYEESPTYVILLTWEIPLVPEYREEPREHKRRLHDMALIMEDIVKGLLELGGSKGGSVERLLSQGGTKIPITEGLVKAAAENTSLGGHEIMEVLFQHQGASLPISEDVVKTAAGNTGSCGYKIMELLFQHQETSLLISEDIAKTAAGNTGSCGYQIIVLVFKRQGTSLSISEDVVKAAAGNTGSCGYKIMELLFQLQGTSLPISAEVVKATAGNTGDDGNGAEIMNLLFKHRGASLSISEEVVKAAAGNSAYYGIGAEIMKLLFQHRGASLPISEEVLKAVAGNPGSCGYEIMKLLFQHQKASQYISEEVVKRATENFGLNRYQMIKLLSQHLRTSLPDSQQTSG